MAALPEPLLLSPNGLGGDRLRLVWRKLDPLHQRLPDLFNGGPAITELLSGLGLLDAEGAIGQLNSDIAP